MWVGHVEESENNNKISIVMNKMSLIKMERDGDTFECWKNRCKDYPSMVKIFVCSGPHVIFE